MEINLYDSTTMIAADNQKYSVESYTHVPPSVPMVLHDPFCTPEYKTKGSAGADLKVEIDVVLTPNSQTVVSTGISLAIPEGFVGLIFPRSGLASRGITLANSVGVIDSDYRGEIKVALVNRSLDTIALQRGDRVAQIVFLRVTQFPFIQSPTLDTTDRGTGGFGSTGV